jgi:hypothetical protein
MANLCSNCVIFSGEPSAIESVKAVFKTIQDQQEATGKWSLPDYVTADFSNMQDISINENTINYETRGYPNLQGLVQIANHFKLDFVSYYDEPANGISGKASYKKGTLLENETPISVKMIEEKKADNPYFKTTNSITKKELNQLYGELLEGDLLLKFAQHKNFDKAREVFQAMEEQTIIEIEKYLINTSHYGPEQFATTDKYIAMAFLKELVSEWNQQRQQPEVNNALSR